MNGKKTNEHLCELMRTALFLDRNNDELRYTFTIISLQHNAIANQQYKYSKQIFR